jgi:dUTP pyrophosphatase
MFKEKTKREMLKVKLLDPRAKAPTVATPGEDLGFDMYALEDTTLYTFQVTKVRTGISIELPSGFGAIIKDRSSMAARGITTSAGVIDSGYRGECVVLLTLGGTPNGSYIQPYNIKAGDKIAQIIPVRVHTCPVEVVSELAASARGEKGFGSSGQ